MKGQSGGSELDWAFLVLQVAFAESQAHRLVLSSGESFDS